MGGLGALEALKTRSSSPCTTVLEAAMMVPELSIFVSTAQVLAFPPAQRPGLFESSLSSCPEICAGKHIELCSLLFLLGPNFQVVPRHGKLLHFCDAVLPKQVACMICELGCLAQLAFGAVVADFINTPPHTHSSPPHLLVCITYKPDGICSEACRAI